MNRIGVNKLDYTVLSVEDRFGVLEARLDELLVEVGLLKSTQLGLREEVMLLNRAFESRGLKVYGGG